MWRLVAIALAATALPFIAPGTAGAINLPAGFQADTLDIPRHSPAAPNGLQAPVSIAFAPGGRVFINEKDGLIKTLDSPSDTSPTLTADLTRDVQTVGDRGLIGLAIDPAYPVKPFVYVSYAYDPSGGDGDGCVVTSDQNYTNCPGSGRVVRIRVDPATGVAMNGTSDQAVNPPQTILASGWCQQFANHAMDDLAFAPDGSLLASAGDGADVGTDYGQYGNPCGDPANEGGSFRSQDFMTSGDPLGYGGSVIRIDPHPEDQAQPAPPTTVAYGLRNPFRIEVRPGTNELYIGDVGWSYWEEIDKASTVLAQGQQPPNFGWPCYDGSHEHEYYAAVADSGHAPICQTLWDPANQTAQPPWFGYLHWEPAAPGEDCHGTYGSSITGLGFYQPALATQGNPFPSGYDGALFFVDYSRGCIWAMLPGSSGAPDPANPTAFGGTSSDTENFWPTDVVQGPDGLYIPNIGDDSITRIRYFSNNVPPVASLTADKTFGATPLNVHFDASGSNDPEGGDLHYAWDLDGDGQFDDGSDQPTASATYSSSTDVTAKVQVTDGGGATDTASLTVHPGDLGPPAPVIDAPSPDLHYTVGDSIAYSGHATDPDAGQPVELDWEFFVRHCPSDCHSHPLGTDPNSSGGELVAPPHEDPSHLELVLTATDSRGLSAVTTRDVFPRRVTVNLESDPAGVPLIFQGTSNPSPWSTTMPAGNQAGVAAPETASIGGVTYTFTGWSDGGERVHDISPRDNLDLIAHYSPPPPPPPPPMRTILLRSRPKGIALRLGPLRQPAPFSDDLVLGSTRLLLAPRRVRLGERIWLFARWSNSGPRRQWITVGANTPYTAVYRLKRHRFAGRRAGR